MNPLNPSSAADDGRPHRKTLGTEVLLGPPKRHGPSVRFPQTLSSVSRIETPSPGRNQTQDNAFSPFESISGPWPNGLVLNASPSSWGLRCRRYRCRWWRRCKCGGRGRRRPQSLGFQSFGMLGVLRFRDGAARRSLQVTLQKDHRPQQIINFALAARASEPLERVPIFRDATSSNLKLLGWPSCCPLLLCSQVFQTPPGTHSSAVQ